MDKYDYTTEDMLEAAAMLDRMAPTLSHGGRRAAKLLASIFMGIDVTPQGDPESDTYPGCVIVLLPIRHGDEHVGHAQVLVQVNPGSDPHVSARFEHLEDSGAFEDDEADNPVTNPNGHPDKGGAQETVVDTGIVEGERRRAKTGGQVWVRLDDMSNDKHTTICTLTGQDEHTIPTKEWEEWPIHYTPEEEPAS